MTKNIFSFIILCIGGLLFVAEVSTKVVRNPPHFSYEVSEGGKSGSASMVVALNSPDFSKKSQNLDWYFEPYTSFKQNLEADMVEIITARGYTLRGPFKTRDEMVYSDKEAAELLFTVSIDPKFNVTSGGWQNGFVVQGIEYKRFKGEIELYGNIIIKAQEPISGEVMWQKNLDIVSERRVIPVNSQKGVNASIIRQNEDNVSLALLAKEDNAVANAVTEALQGSYADILKKIWTHMDPSEFQLMRPKIKILKGKY